MMNIWNDVFEKWEVKLFNVRFGEFRGNEDLVGILGFILLATI